MSAISGLFQRIGNAGQILQLIGQTHKAGGGITDVTAIERNGAAVGAETIAIIIGPKYAFGDESLYVYRHIFLAAKILDKRCSEALHSHNEHLWALIAEQRVGDVVKIARVQTLKYAVALGIVNKVKFIGKTATKVSRRHKAECRIYGSMIEKKSLRIVSLAHIHHTRAYATPYHQEYHTARQ